MLDTPELPATDLNQRIAARIAHLRADRALSLEALATRSGVSRSMISLIERGETSPTAVVLEKLATALGVTLAALFASPQPGASPVARAAEQALWRDPHSGYVRRNVSPDGSLGMASGARSPIQIVEVAFPPGARVSYESAARESAVHQQIWVLDGVVEVTVGSELFRLESGDCLAHVLDQPMSFHNPTGNTVRYCVVIASMPISATHWK